MDARQISGKAFQLLLVRALSGERLSLLLAGRRYTLGVDPLFRISDDSDGCLFLCLGLASLQERLERLAQPPSDRSRESVSKLGGEQGSH